MAKIIHDPYSGSYRVDRHEHLGTFTDKAAAKEAHRNMISKHETARSAEHMPKRKDLKKLQAEHEAEHWRKK